MTALWSMLQLIPFFFKLYMFPYTHYYTFRIIMVLIHICGFIILTFIFGNKILHAGPDFPGADDILDPHNNCPCCESSLKSCTCKHNTYSELLDWKTDKPHSLSSDFKVNDSKRICCNENCNYFRTPEELFRTITCTRCECVFCDHGCLDEHKNWESESSSDESSSSDEEETSTKDIPGTGVIGSEEDSKKTEESSSSERPAKRQRRLLEEDEDEDKKS